MKNVNQIMIAAIAVMAGFQMNAQVIGLRGGYSGHTPKYTGGYSNEYVSLGLVPGVHIGPSLDLKLSKVLSFELGLFLTLKGYDYEQLRPSGDPQYDYSRKGEARLTGLTAPITFKFGANVSKSVRIVAVIGNYVSFGLTGTDDGIETSGNVAEYYSESYYNDNNLIDVLQKFDTGLLFGAGVEINQVEIRASYEMGFLHMGGDGPLNSVLRNQTLNLSLGYRFKDSKK